MNADILAEEIVEADDIDAENLNLKKSNHKEEARLFLFLIVI